MCRRNIFFAVFVAAWVADQFLITLVIKPSQGPSFLPAGKGSQLAKKNLSNIVAAKTVKVHSAPLMPLHVCRAPSVAVCLQAQIAIRRGSELRMHRMHFLL